MSTVQRIARNTTLLLISNIAGFLLSFFFVMYAARYLGAEGFGILSLAIALTAIFGAITDVGLQVIMVKEITRDRSLAQKYLGNVTVIKILLCIITFGLIALTANILHYPPETIRVIYLLALSMLLGAFTPMFYGVFRAYERMEFEALGGVLSGVLLLGGAFYAIHNHFSITGFALIYPVVSIVTLGYCCTVAAWKFTMLRIEVDLAFWKEALKQAWPIGLGLVFAAVYLWIGSVMLSRMKGDEAVGWYNAAYRLIFILQFIPMAYFGAVFPSMSRFHISSKDSLRFVQEKSLKYMLILGVPIGAGTTILAQKIILLIFGGGYYQSVIALQILVWSTVFMFLNGAFGGLFLAVNKQMIATMSTIIATILYIVLNVILIPRYGISGASIAMVVATFISFAINYVGGSKIGYGVPIKQFVSFVVRISIAGAIMCIFIIYFKNFYILALVPLSALLYFAVLYIIGGIDKEDRLLIRQITGRYQAIDSPPNGNDSS